MNKPSVEMLELADEWFGKCYRREHLALALDAARAQGRREGLLKSAEVATGKAEELRRDRDAQYLYEQENGYDNGPLRAMYSDMAEALDEHARFIRTRAAEEKTQGPTAPERTEP